MVLLTTTPGCSVFDPAQCACTEEFRAFTLEVVDADGARVPGIRFDVTIVRTGQKVEVVEWVPGVYTIFDDRFTDHILPDEIVRVKAIHDGRVSRADFVFTVDEPCRCHVDKLAGPAVIAID